MKSTVILLLAATAAALAAPASVVTQQTVTLTVHVHSADGPVTAADVTAGTVTQSTNAAGTAVLRIAPGALTIRVAKSGYHDVERALEVRSDTAITITLEIEALEHEAIIVSSTRSDRRIEDEPLRVEVIGREEIEEKLLMTPGDISMLLNETAGLRVQSTSPSLGGAGVRIQGLRGRYTQILSDGLPLFGGQTGALGALQIPPMDLAQVEVIKGAASALYGASALGGVVNLLSRRPGDERERELLVNLSTLGGADLIGWASEQLSARWGYTLLTGAHAQAAADADDDGWADLPEYRRLLARPRVFWTNERGSSVLFTVGGMLEDREGGTIDGERLADGSTYTEALRTARVDAGVNGRVLLGERRVLTVRGSAAHQEHRHRFGSVREPDAHQTMFAEAALAGADGVHAWVAGVALQHERYRAEVLPQHDFTHTVPGLFAQDEIAFTSALTLALSARLDHHSEYGTFASPRVSALLRPAEDWSVRASAGTGFFAPTPWTEETEAVGLSRLVPTALEAEHARSASLDIGRTIGAFELNATVFASRIADPVQARPALPDSTHIELFNAVGDVRTHGTELLARYHREGIHVTATHVYLRASEPDPHGGDRREVPFTPRHTAGIVGAWEQEGRGRIGVGCITPAGRRSRRIRIARRRQITSSSDFSSSGDSARCAFF